jgi:hypothetical protein
MRVHPVHRIRLSRRVIADNRSARHWKIDKMKRKSLVVAFGTYSLSCWDAFVVQITKRCVIQWAWWGTGNKPASHPEYLNLSQIRVKCAAEVRELAEKYDVPFCGVRRLLYSRVYLALAKKHSIHNWRLGDVLAHARLAVGGVSEAVTWLESPCPELGSDVPMQLMRTQRGRYRVEDALTRLQFSRFVPGQKQVFRFGFPSRQRKNRLHARNVKKLPVQERGFNPLPPKTPTK